jgi:hypothetical protein
MLPCEEILLAYNLAEEGVCCQAWHPSNAPSRNRHLSQLPHHLQLYQIDYNKRQIRSRYQANLVEARRYARVT